MIAFDETIKSAVLDDSTRVWADFIRGCTRKNGLFPTRVVTGLPLRSRTPAELLRTAATEFDRLNVLVAQQRFGESADEAPVWSLPERLRMLAEAVETGGLAGLAADGLALRNELAAERAAHADAVRNFLHAQTDAQAGRKSNARLLNVIKSLIASLVQVGEDTDAEITVRFGDFGGEGLTPEEGSDVLTALALADQTVAVVADEGAQRAADGDTSK
jgi:hypothetical protein